MLLVALSWGNVRAQDPLTQGRIRTEVRAVLSEQLDAWNRGDLDGFMRHYWRSDSLRFVTKSGLLLGFDSLSARYARSYQAGGQMGTLGFDLLRIDVLDRKTVLVIGRWHVSSVAKPSQGHFTLLFTKTDERWVIALDHTS